MSQREASHSWSHCSEATGTGWGSGVVTSDLWALLPSGERGFTGERCPGTLRRSSVRAASCGHTGPERIPDLVRRQQLLGTDRKWEALAFKPQVPEGIFHGTLAESLPCSGTWLVHLRMGLVTSCLGLVVF